MIRALRVLIGMALGLVVVIAPAWGLFHLVRQGSCGDVGMPTCPDQTGLWIIAIVLSATIAGPLAVLIAGTDRRGVPWLLAPMVGGFTIGLFAGAGVSLAGTSATDGTRWIGIVLLGIGAVVALGLVRGLLGALWRSSAAPAAARPPTPKRPAPAPAVATVTVRDQQLGALSSQLRQVMENRATAGSPDTVAPRLRRLTELLDAGLISRAEHDARRREILDEV